MESRVWDGPCTFTKRYSQPFVQDVGLYVVNVENRSRMAESNAGY